MKRRSSYNPKRRRLRGGAVHTRRQTGRISPDVLHTAMSYINDFYNRPRRPTQRARIVLPPVDDDDDSDNGFVPSPPSMPPSDTEPDDSSDSEREIATVDIRNHVSEDGDHLHQQHMVRSGRSARQPVSLTLKHGWRIDESVTGFIDIRDELEALRTAVPNAFDGDRIVLTNLNTFFETVWGGRDHSEIVHLLRENERLIPTRESAFLNKDIERYLAVMYTILTTDDPAITELNYYSFFAHMKKKHILRRERPVITFNLADTKDLHVMVLLYLMISANQSNMRGNRTCEYAIAQDTQPVSTFQVARYENGLRTENVSISGNRISIEGLIAWHTQVMNSIMMMIPTELRKYEYTHKGEPNPQLLSWNGSVESGMRIWLRRLRHGVKLVFYVVAITNPVPGQAPAQRFTKVIEEIIESLIPDCVITIKNDDCRCLIWCIVLGMIVKVKGFERVFNVSEKYILPETAFSKAMFLVPDDSNPCNMLLREISTVLTYPRNLTLQPTHVHAKLYNFISSLDEKFTKMVTIDEFREQFALIEDTIIPNKLFGIDVYGMDLNMENKHIYPLYISNIREPLISLLAITPKNTEVGHFCLITNMRKLLVRSGGKQFISCSDCGKTFFHRSLLFEHICPKKQCSIRGLVCGDGGYHFSSFNDDNRADVIVGSCSKCRLCFTTQFAYDYHMEHCLMKGRTGYRHVRLVSYGTENPPMLNGTAFDIVEEEKHVKNRRMLYADFESYIEAGTGIHHFMSFGLFDWDVEQYYCGYDLGDFFSIVTKIAFMHKEKEVYVYFHNAMGYDANILLKYVLSHFEYNDWGIQVIMKSSNRLLQLIFHVEVGKETRHIHIGDTFLFLTLSLERIVNSIRTGNKEDDEINFNSFFKQFRRKYPFVSDNDIELILTKNIFPYKFFDDPHKLDTPKDEFLEIFRAKEENLQYFSERVTVSDLEQQFIKTGYVMDVYKCKTARDYHDIYLMCDVVQLADVFERCMNIIWESHHVHLTRYIGMPAASWAAFLRHDPSLSIPLYTDTFYAEFFKEMVRGGITSAALRYAKADDMHSIIYLDVNGLYPYVMQKYKFPCGKFEFVSAVQADGKEECHRKLNEIFHLCEVCDVGYCFCVDLHIPDKVKEETDMYPFAPEHRKIGSEYLKEGKMEFTSFLQRWSEINEDETMTEFEGLVCTLYDKEKYNVHWRLLKFYMEHGVEVTKIHFAVSFLEGDYLAGYIRKNIEIRNGRADELGKTVYKLFGNSIYGKTFESKIKRDKYDIIRNLQKLTGLLQEGNIAAITPVDDHAWIVKFDGEDVVLDKPTYIGACVCEFSKLHMYQLLYDRLKKVIFPDGCDLVYTDTDSFIVRVTHPPVLKGCTDEELFDYIQMKDPTLIGKIGGQVKSETGVDTIDEIIALRAKVYAYKTKGGHVDKRAKGTTHEAQEMQLDWEIYKETLETARSFNTRNGQFQRKQFEISSVEVVRQSLSVNDGKRYICRDGIHTHAFGHPEAHEQ